MLVGEDDLYKEFEGDVNLKDVDSVIKIFSKRISESTRIWNNSRRYLSLLQWT